MKHSSQHIITLTADKDNNVITDCMALQHMFSDTTESEQEMEEVTKQSDDPAAKLRRHVETSMHSAKNREQFRKHCNIPGNQCNTLS